MAFKLLFWTAFLYTIGALRSWQLDPACFGCKTRGVLVFFWALIMLYTLYREGEKLAKSREEDEIED